MRRFVGLFCKGRKSTRLKAKIEICANYGRVDISFLGAEVWATFPGLVRGKQSARLSAEHIKPSEARTHFITEVHKNRKS